MSLIKSLPQVNTKMNEISNFLILCLQYFPDLYIEFSAYCDSLYNAFGKIIMADEVDPTTVIVIFNFLDTPKTNMK